MEVRLTCLLCEAPLEVDMKPKICGGEVQEDGLFLKRGLDLFCRLLRGARKEDGGGSGNGGDNIVQPSGCRWLLDKLQGLEGEGEEEKGNPCCENCNEMLMELIKLEEVIKETQAEQQNLFAKLRGECEFGNQVKAQLEVDDYDDAFVPPDSPQDQQDAPDPRIRPCSVSLKRVRLEDFPHLKIHIPPTPSALKLLSKKVDTNQLNRVFYLISEDLLLFLRTPIRFSPEGFSCLEKDCNHFVEGSDYFTFDRMKSHVTEKHEQAYRWTNSPCTCPLCPSQLPNSFQLRRHLLHSHTPAQDLLHQRVICESCWKPTRYDSYRDHVWLHKSALERYAMVACGDHLTSKVRQKLSLKKKKKPKPPPPPRRPPKPKRVDQGTRKNLKNLKKFKRGEDPKLKNLFLIQPDLLTFLCSPIRYLASGLTCLEPGCLHTEPGLTYSSFDRIKSHVIQSHPRPRDYNPRQCPVEGCPEIPASSRLLRRHLLQGHTPFEHDLLKQAVLCESCWRPTQYSSYSYHVWTHKSEEEKAEVISGGTDPKPNQKWVRNKPSGTLPAPKTTRASSSANSTPNLKTRNFFHITDELLLFLATPVKVSSEGFTCLETDCGHVVQGSDFFSFDQVKDHVIQLHEPIYGEEIPRSCPVPSCTETESFSSGRLLRRHLIHGHTPFGNDYKKRLVICESCWKPVLYTSYNCHVLLHKNLREKSDLLEKVKLSSTTKTKISGEFAGRRRRLRVENKITSDGPEASGTPISQRKKYQPENLFYQLGPQHLFHKNVLIHFSPTEMVCQEQCGTRLEGVDYETFEFLQNHVKFSHSLTQDQIQDLYEGEAQPCPVCSLEFSTRSEFKCHIFLEHSPHAICTSCWKPLDTPEEMPEHVSSHMSPEEKKQASVRKHQRSSQAHLPVRGLYCCASCSKTFVRPAQLRAHEEVHLPKHLRQQYPCPDCPLQLLSKAALRSHLERAHRPELVRRRRKCPICPKEFHYRDGERYRAHLRFHSGEKPFICDQCGVCLADKYHLKRHVINVHSTTRSFQCEYCPMNYKHRNNLRRHQKVAHKDLVENAEPEMN